METSYEKSSINGVFHVYDELDNERIDLDFCWVPLEDLYQVNNSHLE